MTRAAAIRRQAPSALWGVAALLFGLLAAAPLLANPGFLLTRGGGDSPFLLQRLHELLAALAGGQFPARWMPNADYGFGYPFFNYYAALPYDLAALFHVYGFSYVASLKLTQVAALLLAAGGGYGWARSLGLSRAQALLAAAAYTFAPFHLVNLYVRGDSLSELWAMSFYPLVLWSAQRCLETPRLSRALTLAGCTALLILSHNISALNFMPFVGLYLLLGGGAALLRRPGGDRRQRAWRPVLVGLAALAWGLALSAFFWLPALREISAVQLADVTQGYFYYGNHFRAADLVQPGLFFNAETGAGLPTPFSMSLAQAIATALGLVVMLAGAVRARRWTTTHSFLLLGLALATFMITPASAWLWANLPLLRYTQFPWRFLSIQALFAAAMIAHLVPGDADAATPEARGRWPRWAAALGIGLVLAVTTVGQLRPDFIPLSDVDVTPQRLQLLEYFSANIGSTIGFEYLPRGVKPRPYASDVLLDRPPRLKTLRGQAAGSRLWQRGAAEAWTVTAAGGPATVAIPTQDWPGWTASLDGQNVPVRAADGLGWITLDVPAGTRTLLLQLGPTPTRTLADAVSLLALALPIAFLGAVSLRARRSGPVTVAKINARMAAVGLAGVSALAAGALLLHAVPVVDSSLPLSIDFAQLTYLHRDVIKFEGGTRLTRVAYNADHLARGQDLVVQSTWSPAAAGQATLSLVPASNLLDQAPVQLATATQQLSGAGSATLTSTLPVPLNIPPGVYFVTVEWADQAGPRAALTSAGRRRGLVHLAPVWIDDPGPALQASAPLAQFGPAIALLSAQASTPVPGVLQFNSVWQARQDIAANAQIALRLRDAAGAEWTASDTQLAYGYYPTSMWRPGETVPDFYRLRLPDGTPPGSYTLDLSLYDPARGATQITLGSATLPVTIVSATPRGARLPRYELTPEISLADVAIVPQFQQGEAPELRADWLTSAAPPTGLRARWTLVAVDGTRVSQVLDLAYGSPPTTWPANAFIQGRVRLGTAPSLAPGRYALALALVGDGQQQVGPEVTVAQVEVSGRPRSFTVPPVATAFTATYAGVIKLWGYDSQQTADALRLTLVWSALSAPGRDYKFFVHLFNPDDGSVVAQFDAIPRNFTYPTVIWLKGEVVSDTVQLPLTGVAPGAYNLAVGWYDPAHPEQRLPAVDAQGQPLPDDRVVLPLSVRLP